MKSTATTLSNSKVKDWRRCPHLYRLKRIDGWRPKARSIQLERGSWVHELIMCYYDGEDWEKRHELLTKKFYNLFEEIREELGDLPGECERIMRTYLRHYKDDTWEVVETEMDEIIELPNGQSFRFIIDLIVRENGQLWLVDHKTVKNWMDPDFHLLDAQLARYAWCAEQKGYAPIAGVIYNELRTKPPAIPEVLKSGQLSQRKNIDTDAATYLQTIKEHGLDPKPYIPFLRYLRSREDEKFFRRSRLPKSKGLMQTLMNDLVYTAREIQRAEKANEFPRSPDKACSFCDYRNPCQIELLGGDPSHELREKFTQRTKEKEDLNGSK